MRELFAGNGGRSFCGLMKVFFLVVFIVILSGCGGKKKTKVLKLAHSLEQTSSVHQAMLFMAKRLEEKSNGTLKIDIYPNGQLGSERECIELLQIGSLAITKVSAATLEGFVEEYKVLGLPYIFRSRQHCFNVLDGEIGKSILQKGERYWLRGLGFYDAGSRSFYTTQKAVRTPDDLNGLKIRVLSSITAVEMIKEFGAAPTPISWGELYTALQSGVVDGAENNPPSLYLSHQYEVCKYYTLNEHTTVPDVVIIGTVAWNKLTAQEQQWLQEAMDESVVYQRKLWLQSENEALEEIKKSGVEIIVPDKEPFAKKVEGIYDTYKDNPNIYNLIQQIKNHP